MNGILELQPRGSGLTTISKNLFRKIYAASSGILTHRAENYEQIRIIMSENKY